MSAVPSTIKRVPLRSSVAVSADTSRAIGENRHVGGAWGGGVSVVAHVVFCCECVGVLVQMEVL